MVTQLRPTPNPAGKNILRIQKAVSDSMQRLTGIIGRIERIKDLKKAQRLIDAEILRLQRELAILSVPTTDKSTMAGVLRVGRKATENGVVFKKLPNTKRLSVLLKNQRRLILDYKLVTQNLRKRLDDTIINGVTKRQLTSTPTRVLETALGQPSTQTDILKFVLDNELKLIDSAGRAWDPVVYSKMVARTRTRQFMTQGLETQMQFNSRTAKGSDFELYQVTDYGGVEDEECRVIQGNIYRYSWAKSAAAKKYPIAPRRTPVHPNCKHTETPVFIN